MSRLSLLYDTHRHKKSSSNVLSYRSQRGGGATEVVKREKKQDTSTPLSQSTRKHMFRRLRNNNSRTLDEGTTTHTHKKEPLKQNGRYKNETKNCFNKKKWKGFYFWCCRLPPVCKGYTIAMPLYTFLFFSTPLSVSTLLWPSLKVGKGRKIYLKKNWGEKTDSHFL